MHTSSLKRKIISTIIISGFFLCLITGLTVFFYLNKVLTNEKIQEINKLSVEQINQNNQIFKNYQVFAEMLGTRTRVKEYLQLRTEARRAELLGIFSDYAKEDKKYLSLYLLDKKGVALISTDPAFVGQDYSFRDYYKKSINGQPWMDLLLGKTSNQFGYYFSYPVFDENKNVLGVFVAKINDQEVNDSILNSELVKESTVMLTDEYGVVLYSSQPERFLKSMGQLTVEKKDKLQQYQKFLQRDILPLQYDAVENIINNYKGEQTVQLNDQVDKQTEIISVNKVGEFPFYLVTETGLQNITKTISSTLIILISLIFLGIFLVSYLVFRLLTGIIKPLDDLRLFSEIISKGDFSRKLEIKRNDEFGRVAEAFNSMSDNLNNLYASLDKEVQNNTKELQAKNLETENQKKAILNILEDVEKEKEKSEKLSRIVEDTNEPIVSKTTDGVILSWNRGAEEFYGYLEREMLGQSIKIIVPPEKYEEVDGIMKLVSQGKRIEHYETIRKKKDGTLVNVSLTASPIKDSLGKIIGISVITMDITKEKELDKQKDEVISFASHQLKNPITATSWSLELLLDGAEGKLNEKQEKTLKEIYASNKNMLELVTGFLDISKIEASGFKNEKGEVDMVKISDSVLDELAGQISDKKIHLEKKYGDVSLLDIGEKTARVILQNLLTNAVKYTPENGTVEIKIEKNIEGTYISVKDTGYGIPEKDKARIFSKLFRADNIKEKEPSGTGLGLYLLKSLVEKMGGKVWFESKEGTGTTFYVQLK